MRFRLWLALCGFLLVSCGQPLRVATRPSATPSPSNVAITSTSELTQGETTLPVTTQVDQATSEATDAVPVATPQPVLAPSVAVVPRTTVPQTSAEAWLAQQEQLQVFEAPRTYGVASPVVLWWFDPLTAQSLPVGRITGSVTADATFVFKRTGEAALRVPYTINVDYGLTAISPAVQARMLAAGFAERVEAYVVQSDQVTPQ